VIEVLARDGQCLIEAQRIIDELRRRNIGSPASVYRVLRELCALGLLHRRDGRDGVARYEIADHDADHHHLIDEQTGAIRPFTDRHLDQALRDAAKRLGVELTTHEVILHGRQPETRSNGRGRRHADSRPRAAAEHDCAHAARDYLTSRAASASFG